jgi:hypothetical protein
MSPTTNAGENDAPMRNELTGLEEVDAAWS